tara:strand:- start:192 stop:752 length:561 start_codon:yes stop_codon:yes gene_type:complete
MKLNLGCGSKILEGYTNIDKFDYYKPDIVHDLEITPYPFEENSIDEIILNHVLEHIGQDPNIFNNIIKELYRICKNKTVIHIRVPHPRHDDFISDPTHVRPVTILGLQLYDKELNEKWEKGGFANSPLALIHNVNFKVLNVVYVVDDKYKKLLNEKKITEAEVNEFMHKYNNVIKEIQIEWSVIKD